MKEAPWRPHPRGRLPRGAREHLVVLRAALRDLPAMMRHDATVEAAAGMTFFTLFSVFPAALFIVTLLPWLPFDAPLTRYIELLRPLLPPEIHGLLQQHLADLLGRPRQGLLTASAALALFSASRALVSLSRALNRAHRVPRVRSEILRRLRSMGLLLAASLGLVAGVVALSLGDQGVGWLVAQGHLQSMEARLLDAVRWPILLTVSTFLVQQLYALLPDRRPRWRPFSTGALVAVLGWTAATWAFSSFAARFVRFNVAYGSLGTAMLLMAWTYLGCLALMIGGSLDALLARGLPETTDGPGRPPA